MMLNVIEYLWPTDQPESHGRPPIKGGDRVYAIQERVTGDMFRYAYVLESDAKAVMANLEYGKLHPGAQGWRRSFAALPKHCVILPRRTNATG
jgi:hypothetical protein